MPLTVAELRQRLRDEDIRSSTYSLGEPLADNTYCIVETTSDWQVFFYERGLKENLVLFSAFPDAAEHFLELILRDPTTRSEPGVARRPTRHWS
jgi:hypothetical protein